MEKCIVRQFVLDEDICEVVFRFNQEADKYIGDYPDFEQSPRITKNGFAWVNATQDGCSDSEHKYYKDKTCLDCGSCVFFKTEKPGDLIGVCNRIKADFI